MKCPGCSREVDDAFEYCPYCGKRMPEVWAPAGTVDAEVPTPPAVEGAAPPETGLTETPVREQPPAAPRKKKSFSEWWSGLSRKGKVIVVAVGAFILLVIIAAPFSATEKEKKADNTVKEETSQSAVTEEKEEEPEKTVDAFITITNVRDGQELTVGPSVIAGTAKEECSITCNGAPVGFAAGTMDFAPTVMINEGANTVSFVVTDKKGKTYNKNVTVTGILAPETYKAVSPAGPPFANLNKNPDSYAGTRCQYRGKVVQCMESGGMTDIRMDITPMGYGYWTDTIYVTYAGTTPAVEDNIIIVYGTVKGSYTYTSQANYEITLPCIDARYVDVVQ